MFSADDKTLEHSCAKKIKAINLLYISIEHS